MIELKTGTIERIVFMPNGVEGLQVAPLDGPRKVVPLRRGDDVSLQFGGKRRARSRPDPCAVCDGERCLKGRADCTVPHLVYVAVFGRRVKVGVTKEARFKRRMREQGAEFSAKVSRFGDGMKARRAERELSSGKGIGMGVRFEEKVTSIGQLEDERAAGELLESKGLEGLSVSDMRGMYQNPALGDSSRPILFVGDGLRGTVEDTRGEALFFSYRDNLYAYDLRDTVGRKIRYGEARMETQLTLGNF